MDRSNPKANRAGIGAESWTVWSPRAFPVLYLLNSKRGKYILFKLTDNRKFVLLFKIEFLSNKDKTYFRIIRVRLEKKRCSVKSKIRDVFRAIDRNYIID